MNKHQTGYTILGVHFGHDASASIVVDGELKADVMEERFVRIKHSADPPLQAIKYCLEEAKISINEIDEIALAGFISPWHARMFEIVFGKSLNLSEDSPLYQEMRLQKAGDFSIPNYLRIHHLGRQVKVSVVEHHLAHAASAYYTIPMRDNVIVATIDGVGDKFSTNIWRGHNNRLTPIVRYGTEGSLGRFYNIVAEALGFRVGDGEGKVMGLAAYGDYECCAGSLDQFHPKFSHGQLVEPHKYGPFSPIMLRGSWHDHCEDSMAVSQLVQQYGPENIASEAQRILEEEVLSLVIPWIERYNADTIASAGGVFLNVKLNQRLHLDSKVVNYFPYHNAGDAGLAVGAALYCAARNGSECIPIQHTYFGPGYTNEEILDILDTVGTSSKISDCLTSEVAEHLVNNKIVGWFQGRQESGPRALGNRSILMSPHFAKNKDIINCKVKYREPFRPFAPSILDTAKEKYMQVPHSEPFMTTAVASTEYGVQIIPATVHVDGSMRPQTVEHHVNPTYAQLLSDFGDLSGTHVLLNTSFNIKGEPIICTPLDAIRCFFSTGIDVLVLGNFLLEK